MVGDLFSSRHETLRELCERMKFSAGFLQWESSRRPAVTSLIAQHAMFEIRNLEPRAALCFRNEYSDEVRT